MAIVNSNTLVNNRSDEEGDFTCRRKNKKSRQRKLIKGDTGMSGSPVGTVRSKLRLGRHPVLLTRACQLIVFYGHYSLQAL